MFCNKSLLTGETVCERKTMTALAKENKKKYWKCSGEEKGNSTTHQQQKRRCRGSSLFYETNVCDENQKRGVCALRCTALKPQAPQTLVQKVKC